jgi:hypothetical protein
MKIFINNIKMLDLYKNISYVARNRYDAIEPLEILMEDPTFDPSMDNNKAIILASEFGRADLVEKLLNDSRVDPSDQSNDALLRAVSNGWLEIVQILLKDKKVDPSDRNNAIFKVAASKGSQSKKELKQIYTEIIRVLISDSRVEWRTFHSKFKDEIYKIEENELKDFLTTSYLTLKKVTPTITLDNEDKNLIPNPIFKKIVYEGVKNDLCSSITKGGVPPMKLVALAKILKIRHNSKMTRVELCKKINYAILSIHF